MNSKTLLYLTLPMLLLSACSDNKKPSKEKFAAAIQERLKENPSGQEVCGTFTSPLEERTTDYKASAREDDFFKSYEVLAKKGYLTIKDMPANAESSEPYIRVSVTDKFIQDFGEPQQKAGFFTTSAGDITTCYADSHFKEVTDFTEPSESMGMKVSQADYTMTRSLKTDKPWLKDQELLDALGLRINLQEEKRQALMVLKDSGWVVGD